MHILLAYLYAAWHIGDMEAATALLTTGATMTKATPAQLAALRKIADAGPNGLPAQRTNDPAGPGTINGNLEYSLTKAGLAERRITGPQFEVKITRGVYKGRAWKITPAAWFLTDAGSEVLKSA